MGATLQPLKVLTEQEQVLYFYARGRRMSLNDISKGLFRTLFLPLTPADHLAALWPNRDTLYTIMAEIQIDGTLAEGVIVEIGGAVHGAGITMSAGVLFAFAGSNGTTGVDVSFTPAVGRRLWVALVMSPGNAKIAMYIDGRLEARGVSTAGTFLNGLWAAAGVDAGIGQVNATHNSRVPAVDALSNVSMVSLVSFFSGQAPRGFIT
ncbi:MAG: hypothetical protein V3W44_10115 [Dehalococcoidales bacterium]